MVKPDIWQLVKEPFDEKIPRRTALVVKEEEDSLSFAYPAEFSSIGYLFESRNTTAYGEFPLFSIRFAELYFPDLSGGLARNSFYYENMEYRPDQIRRKIVFSNIGMEAEEKFVHVVDGGFQWEINLVCRNHPPYRCERNLYTVLTLNHPEAEVEYHEGENCLEIRTGGKKIFIAGDFENHAVYERIDDYLKDMEKGEISGKRTSGHYVVCEHRVKMRPGENRRIRFGISTHSEEKSLTARAAEECEQPVREKWNRWFHSIPHPEFQSEDERRTYYKCWWVIKLNYYRDERYGRTVLEALPVYKGWWQWALPAIQWHTSLNPEVDSDFMKRVLDLFLITCQREDGYVPHAVYVDEPTPGERWGKTDSIQTPHIAWVCWRYYRRTRDRESIRRWYPRLKKYYQYLQESRDEKCLKLHLWAMITHYETGMDDFPSLHRVSYGAESEEGIPERFCYPAIFAGERCYYEKAMAHIAETLGEKEEAAVWRAESERTRQAMNRFLWDDDRKWYGVLHEDKTRETIVGCDGLIPFAYGLVEKENAELAKENFARLLGTYGVFTVAPDEKKFHEEIYWQGPVWPTSCAFGMAAACQYYPEYKEEIKKGVIRFAQKYPSIWECMSGKTGKIGHGPSEVLATPVISSNVGAGGILGTLLLSHGENVFAL